MIKATEKIWHNGKLIGWNDAQIHVLAHVLHYGSSVFEGLRCYMTQSGPAVFRGPEHMRRLIDSAKIYRMKIPYSVNELVAGMHELLVANKMESCYVRPLAFRGFGDLGVLPTKDTPMETFIACWEWGKYLGAEAMEQGVDVCISSWNRLAPNTMPSMSKAGANYMNSQLIRMESAINGYAEGIALDVNGFVSEGSGENIFVVRDGKIHTPPLGNSVLPGITRASVITLARDAGFEVIETLIPREMLYIADEVFFTGTAAEVTPIRTVDKIEVGAGSRGPITEQLQTEFFDIVEGKAEDRYNWLTPVGQPVAG